MNFPEHTHLQLEHNPHKVMGMTIGSYYDGDVFRDVDWVSKEEKEKSVQSQDVWELTWFNKGRERLLLGHDLDNMLRIASLYDCGDSRSVPAENDS